MVFEDFNEKEHPIMYISCKLTPTEQQYAAVEKKALTLKWAIEELRYYDWLVTGCPFTLITDHAS